MSKYTISNWVTALCPALSSYTYNVNKDKVILTLL